MQGCKEGNVVLLCSAVDGESKEKKSRVGQPRVIFGVPTSENNLFDLIFAKLKKLKTFGNS
jgi:hypothetical protein